MPLMPLTDAMFLLGESREHPMHVGGLQIFRRPEGAGTDFVAETYQQALEVDRVSPLFKRRAAQMPPGIGPWGWVDDDRFDLEYHARHLALPRPGRVRELLALASRQHGSLLDRNRPLWEFCIIEGLEGDRFAAYTKVHHAMVDGVAALRLLRDALSDDPDVRDTPPPWATEVRSRPRPTGDSDGSGDGSNPFQSVARAIGDLAGTVPALVATVRRGLREQAAVLPFQAPGTMFNVPITGARRFAADSWELDRIAQVGKATGATVNDVVLAMCSGALRRYLFDAGALPERPLVAMVPVSLRRAEDAGGGGNAVGTILCNLATNVPDPEQRLAQIMASMREGKANLSGLSPLQVMTVSALMMSPLVVSIPLYRLTASPRPAFNLVISNVPGPRQPLYWNGARLEGIYPLSIPADGMALNITVNSYVDHMEFGLIGCRRSVPHLQRLLTDLEDSLRDLEKAVA